VTLVHLSQPYSGIHFGEYAVSNSGICILGKCTGEVPDAEVASCISVRFEAAGSCSFQPIDEAGAWMSLVTVSAVEEPGVNGCAATLSAPSDVQGP